MAVANTLACFDMAIVTAVRKFYCTDPRWVSNNIYVVAKYDQQVEELTETLVVYLFISAV